MARTQTLTGRLARLGFTDPDTAERLLGLLPELGDDLLLAVAASADPDLALRGLERLYEALPDGAELVDQTQADDQFRTRLLAVLGLSEALGDHLVTHPGLWRELLDPDLTATRPTRAALRTELIAAVGADPEAAEPVSTLADSEAVDRLRVGYRRLLLRLAVRDLTGALRMWDVAAELADLAGGTLDAALAIARARLGEEAVGCRLAVIGLGKCGARELNYVSDVDVVFVGEPDESGSLRCVTKLAGHLIRICSDYTGEGTIWQVDAALRPEGKAGPLVRTLDSHRAYYERWAKTWEFQALLKARPVAGDLELGREYAETVGPMVWQAADRDGFVEEVQAMRRRVVDHIPAGQEHRQLKLGAGGLRDVEFAVQLLQLVHGRTDERLRSPNTLQALDALIRGGYVGRADGAHLSDAYTFLRTLEHRIQLQQLKRTHMVPESSDALRRLGRSLGVGRYVPADKLSRRWKEQRLQVQRLHEKLFYRPLLAAVASLPGDDVRLTPEAAKTRLTALGYLDPGAALRHLEALTAGVSRQAAIQRQLLPVMLSWFADGPDPDHGLLAYRRVSEALGRTGWYLRRMRDDGELAERMAKVLSTSRYATHLLMRAPEAVQMLGGDLGFGDRDRDSIEADMFAAVRRNDDPEAAARAVRAIRRRELLRCAAADLLGVADLDRIGDQLSDLTNATVSAALRIAERTYEEQRGELPCRIAVVAVGRLGGHELSYGSDVDALFVQEPREGAEEREAQQAAMAVAQRLRQLLAAPGGDPPLKVDADLRPEGKQGPLVRSFTSYASYYDKWAQTWESQALLRAEPACGDPDLGRRFIALVDPLRYPAGGLSVKQVAEIRRMKARIDAERLPRGADPATHLKLGRGGLADIEWTVQLLQLRHAHEVPGLRTTRTLPALDAAVEAGLVAADDAETLATAWRLVSLVRNAITLVRDRASDTLPHEIRERAGVAFVCGYPVDQGGTLQEDYLRVTRRARTVVDRVFWD